jgi:hypothetical protein
MEENEKLVYAIFWDEKTAGKAIRALDEAHFDEDEIGVLMRKGPEGSEVEEVPVETETEAKRGGIIGAVVGAIGGALLLVGSGFLAAGPFVVALAGALAGGATGSAVGVLMGMGFWHDEIEFPHKEELREGAILVGVKTHKRVDAAREALESVGAEDVHVRSREEAIDEVEHAHR